MSDQEVDTLLREERAFSSKLAKKVQEQAGELKRQADVLDWAAQCRQEFTERLLELDPGFFGKKGKNGTRPPSPVRDVLRPNTNPAHVVSALARQRNAYVESQLQINKLEKQLKDAQRKSAEANKQNRELRKLLDRHRKDYGAARLRADRLTDQLAGEVGARKAAENHARRLEITFERSGKGVALMKAAKSGSDLEIALKTIETLEAKLQEKVQQRAVSKCLVSSMNFEFTKSNLTYCSSLSFDTCPQDHNVPAIEDDPKRTVDTLAPAVEGSSHCAALQSRILELEAELEKYRQTGCQRGPDMESTEMKIMKEKIAALGEREETMLATCEKLKTKIEEEGRDKAALLDYVQELQDERDSLLKGRGANTRAASRNHEAQKRSDHQAASLKTMLLDAQNDLGQYKARLSTLESREALVQSELLSLQKSEADAQMELTEAHEEIEHLGNYKRDLEKELQDAQTQNEVLQKNWEEKQQLLSRIQSDLVETDRRLIDSEQEVRRLRDVCDTNMELRTRETTLLELVDDLRTKTEQLKRSLRKEEARCQHYLDLQERVLKFIESPDDIESLAKLEPLKDDEKSARWIEKVKYAIERGKEAEKELETKESQRHEVSTSLEEMAVQHRALQSRHDEALKSRETLINQVDELMKETDQMKCIESRNDALVEDLTKEKKTNAELIELNEKIRRQYEDLLGEFDELREQRTRGDDVLHHTKEERDALSDKVGTLRDRLKELESKYREASESTRKLRHLADIESRAEQLEKSSKEIRSERDRLAERVEEYSRNMQSVEALLKETESSKHDLVAELDRMHVAMESLKGERAELTSQVERDVSLRLKLGRLLSRVPSDTRPKESTDDDPIVATVRTLVLSHARRKTMVVSRDGSVLGTSPGQLPSEKDNAAPDISTSKRQTVDTCESAAFCDQRSRSPSREVCSGQRTGLDEDVSHLQDVIHQKNQKISGLRELVRKICDVPGDWTPTMSDFCAADESREAPGTCDDLGLTSKSTKAIAKLLAVDKEEYAQQSAHSDPEAPHPIRDKKKETLQKQLKDLHSSFRGMREKYKDARNQ